MDALEGRVREPARDRGAPHGSASDRRPGFCYATFLLFETFALALDRLSPIRLRGLFEEHPERARILGGAGEIEITRTTTKVVVQILLLTGLLTVVHAFAGFGPAPAVGLGRRRFPCWAGC